MVSRGHLDQLDLDIDQDRLGVEPTATDAEIRTMAEICQVERMGLQVLVRRAYAFLHYVIDRY